MRSATHFDQSNVAQAAPERDDRRERGEILEGADLGDERLEHRLVRLAEQLAKAPATSFPKAATSDSELEATYRFLGNDRVTPEEIMLPHVRRTLARMRRRSRSISSECGTTRNREAWP